MAVLLGSVLFQIPSVVIADSGQWVKYSGNPVLGPTPGGWDADYTVSPKVVYDGSTFRMWYDGGLAGATSIGYATSNDGITWTKYPNPVLTPGEPGTWDASQVGLGSVVWNGTLFFMWYRANNAVTFPNGAVGLATSMDGINWIKYSSNPVLRPTEADQRYIASPFVVRYSLTNAYYMWYTGRSISDPESRILYATSFDGVNWFKWPSPVLSPSSDAKAWDSSSVFSPSVIYDGSIFGLWYSGLDQSLVNPRIGFASSPDGATWIRSSANPILSLGLAGSWDSAGVEQTSVVIGNGYMLYYDGFSKAVGGRIGLAMAPQSFNIPEFPVSTAGLLIVVLFAVSCIRYHKIPRRKL